jgi:hypothetical protein
MNTPEFEGFGVVSGRPDVDPSDPCESQRETVYGRSGTNKMMKKGGNKGFSEG